MPELPEVETTKTSLMPLVGKDVSQVVIRQPKLRYPIPSNLVDLVGYRLTGLHRRAKYLLLDFTQGDHHKVVLIHLGMSGSLQQKPTADSSPDKHDHLLIVFGETTLYYHDPRRFGMVLWVRDDDSIDDYDTEDRFLSHLGPEPLSDDFDASYLYQLIHRHGTKTKSKPMTKPIKAVIMDQAVVVGVGNIYAAESLFLSHIHPATPACLLSMDDIATLVAHIKRILAIAIDKGGSSLKDFMVGNGKTGYFQQTLLAYGRDGEACIHCQTPLENIKITGRSSVYCPRCQPLL